MNELRPFCLGRGSFLFGFGVVDVLASVKVMADRGGEGIGGVEELGDLLETQHGLKHLRDLFLGGVAVAGDGLLDGTRMFSFV